MKHAIVILSGAADEPADELSGRTPLAAASMPALTALARAGRVGTVATAPRGWRADAETCLLTLLGHDPVAGGAAAGPIAAAGLGFDTGGAASMRLDLVTIGPEGTDGAGTVLDATGGGIPSAEADALLADLLAHWRMVVGSRAADLSLAAARGNRGILLDRSGRDYAGVAIAPSRFLVGEDAGANLAVGGDPDASGLLRELVESSYDFLTAHEVNRTRVEQGLVPANLAWLWGAGATPVLPSLAARFGLSGLALGRGPVFRGVARLAGWDVLEDAAVDDDPALGRQAVVALSSFGCVLVHADGPDRAARAGDAGAKAESLESIDRHIIAPLAARLARCGDPETDPGAEGWRMMVGVDHASLCRTGEPDSVPVPVMMAGAWIRSVVERPMNEASAAASDMHIEPGHEMLEFFFRGGLARVAPRSFTRAH